VSKEFVYTSNNLAKSLEVKKFQNNRISRQIPWCQKDSFVYLRPRF